MSSTTNLEGEEIVDAPGKDGNASMPEQVRRPNPVMGKLFWEGTKKKEKTLGGPM
jgi:hypothetical protein